MTLCSVPAFGNSILDPGSGRIDDRAPALDEFSWYHTPHTGRSITRPAGRLADARHERVAPVFSGSGRCKRRQNHPAERTEEESGQEAAAGARNVVTHAEGWGRTRRSPSGRRPNAECRR